ncbi:MAG: L-2-hydroxyglutarate oxidase [Bdellovibrionales bacterium]|nr:L-2-hydroxyglutarate oxidase [Bdellovibrionales bacterium]
MGLATAYTFLHLCPSLSLCVCEKEEAVGQHQSSHNSGVIHTGVYYPPGSQKAKNCTRGRQLLLRFCDEHHVAYRTCGKVIVATEVSEVPYLNTLAERAKQNGVSIEPLDREALKKREPYVRGVEALEVFDAGVIRFKDVCQKLSELIHKRGGVVRCGATLRSASYHNRTWSLTTAAGVMKTKRVITCAGLYSDRVAQLFGHRPSLRIIPFRGEYYTLTQEAAKFCQSLIYPVPHPLYPFLGVHLTRTLDGMVECGPSAVLAFSREGYTKSDVSLGDMREVLGSGRFWKMAAQHWKFGVSEMATSFFKDRFVRAVQKLVPEVRSEHLVPGGSGVRAQTVASDGSLVGDFVIEEDRGVLHLLNAPSPAATSCFAIAEELYERSEKSLHNS